MERLRQAVAGGGDEENNAVRELTGRRMSILGLIGCYWMLWDEQNNAVRELTGRKIMLLG